MRAHDALRDALASVMRAAARSARERQMLFSALRCLMPIATFAICFAYAYMRAAGASRRDMRHMLILRFRCCHFTPRLCFTPRTYDE